MTHYAATGYWWGAIAEAPRGEGGFGYDPVFIPEGSDLSVAEWPQEAKDQASHRALAGRALVDVLRREGLLHGAPRSLSRRGRLASLADLTNHSLKSRAAAVSIASNAILIAFKLTVGILSGSIAIISEALHSGSDLVAALIAFWSVRRAAEPPDERHQYGHEKVENLSGVIEALLIIAAAAVIIFEGVMKIIDGPQLDHIWLGIGVMVVSGIVEPHRLAQGAVSGRAADAVGGARGRRRPPHDRRLHVVRRGLRAAARQDHRLAVLRPDRGHRRRRAHHPDGLRAGDAVDPCPARRDAARRGARGDPPLRARAPRRHHHAATTSCGPGARAAAGTSTCTSWSTRTSRSPRRTTSPSTSKTTSAPASPTPTCWSTSSRARRTGSRRLRAGQRRRLPSRSGILPSASDVTMMRRRSDETTR